MTSATFSTSPEAQQAATLLEGYRFELGQHDARQWVSLWLEFYRPSWIRDAVIEALYQGRYKSVSVRQILELWQRRGQPIRHATHDFESAVCREFGEVKLAPVTPAPALPLSHASPAKAISKNSVAARPPARAVAAAKQPHHFNRFNEWRSHQQQYTLPSPAPSPAPTSPPAPSRKIATLRPQQTAAVSFNLAELAASPGMAAHQPANGDTLQADTDISPAATALASTDKNTDENGNAHSSAARQTVMDNKAWRDFPSYTTPAYAISDRDEALRAQRQLNGVLYSSARAIQPFKPALPFSAQTLRLAKQKAIALMAEAK